MAASMSRPRAYGVLALGCLAAGCLAALFDQVTVSISPEYFLDGKGLASAEGLRWQVAWLGFRAGLPLGALVVGIGLLRAQATSSFSWSGWLGRIGTTVLAGLALGVLVMVTIDPFSVRSAS